MSTSLLGRLALTAALLASLSCESGKSPGALRASEGAEVAPPPAPAAAQPAAPAAAAHGSAVEWSGKVDWRKWEDGLVQAGKTGKPILLLVYADWCPHCRTLGPVFAEAEMEALAKRFVMVRQNHDEDPAWLQPYKQHGSYVPRIFFFDSKGKLREDVVSGHPRYPYFYASEQPAFLKQSMRRVIGT